MSAWPLVAIDEVCEAHTELLDPTDQPDAYFDYIDISAVDNTAKQIVGSRRLLGKEAPSRARQLVRKGDVLVATTRPNLNAVALVGDANDGHVASTGFSILRSKPGLLPGFLFLWVQSPKFVERISFLVQGALYPAVTDQQVRDLTMPLPSVTEQRQIVAALDAQLAAATRARAAVAAQLEAAPRVDEAVLRDLFVSATWSREALGDLARITGGIQKTPDRFPVSFHRPFLTVRNVQRNSLDLSVVERFEVRPDELEKYRLAPGDLLIVEGNGSRDHIGRNALFPDGMPEEWIHQNHIIRVRLNRARLMPEFVSAFLNSDVGRAQMLKKAETTSGLYTLSTAKVASLDVPVPSLAEQANIVRDLQARSAATQRLIAALREKLAALDILPARLLARAFTDPHGQENQEAQLAIVR
jgi:type I restriction enzyme S subunit